ncbi:hypothetical protein ACFQT0_14465 [Hymenobacter humi]|uniref:Glycosyltransferase n=1 Tax=Hymenobacter humi TaxID=1411620 RepID=A0ABW2U6A7_9BACT
MLAQRADWPGPVEIILFDDGSGEEIRKLNRPLGAQPGVRYHGGAQRGPRRHPQPGGRGLGAPGVAAAARQRQPAARRQVFARYAAARHQAPLLIGGTSYAPLPPADTALHLRWLYGHSREARPAAVRQQAPHAQLTINNVLMHADILARFPLDEQLNGYGHEDTTFGLALAAARIDVFHLDNPVLHAGLEPAAAFLQKSEEAVHNLVQAFRDGGVAIDSRLLRLALRLRKLRLATPTRVALAAIEPPLRRNLLSATPRLQAFDMLKLRWLLKLL